MTTHAGEAGKGGDWGAVGRLALQIGGAVVGSFFGMPWLGAAVGSMLGGVLFPGEGQQTQGPQLDDLNVQASSYGAVIGRAWGTVRMAGNIIWAPPLNEVKKVHEQGGKGGAPESSHTEYLYFADFALGLCAGPVKEYITIWADNKPIYTSASGLKYDKASIAFYYGTEDQMPDPTIEAEEGVGNVPAHRGLAYIVFRNLPLKDFGNRIPNISVELLKTGEAGESGFEVLDAATHNVADMATNSSESRSGNHAAASIVAVPDGTLALCGTTSEQGTTCRIAIYAGQNEAITQVSVDELDFSAAAQGFIDFFGNLTNPYVEARLNHNSDKIAVLYRNSSYIIAMWIYDIPSRSFGDPVDVWQIGTSYNYAYEDDAIFWDGSGKIGILMQDAVDEFQSYQGPAIHWFYLASDTPVYDHTDFLFDTDPYDYRLFSEPGVLNAADGDAYVPYVIWDNGQNPDTTMMRLVPAAYSGLGAHITLNFDASAIANNGFTRKIAAVPIGDDGSSREYIALTSANDSAGQFGVYGFKIGGGSSALTKPFVDLSAIASSSDWRDDVETVIPTGAILNIITKDTTGSGWQRTHWPLQMSESSFGSVPTPGEIKHTTTLDWMGHRERITAVETAGGNWLTANAYGDLYLLPLGGAQAESALVGQVVREISELCGLDADTEVDVSGVSNIKIDGYAMRRQTDGRGALQPLLGAFAVDVVCAGDTVVFKQRGAQAPTHTIYQDELAARADESGPDEQLLKIERTADSDLPKDATITYSRAASSYDKSTQTAQRHGLVVKDMGSGADANDRVDFEQPMVLSDDTARGLVRRMLYEAWNRRNSLSLAALPTCMAVEPADTITIYANQRSYQINVDRVDLGANGVVEIKGSVERSEVLSGDTAVGGSPLGAADNQQITGAITITLMLLNLPALRDGDAATPCYYAAVSSDSPDLVGASLIEAYEAGDQGREVAQIFGNATAGTLSAAVSATVATTWDRDTTITIQLDQGSLESRPEIDVLNGRNALLIGDEVVQFADAVEVSAGTYEVSTLLRGRLGTDDHMAHAAGERVVLLDADGIARVDIETSKIGLQRYLSAEVINGTADNETETDFTPNGENLRPFSPVHIQGARDGSGNLTISWVRRARVGGAWRDYVDVPLAEDSEAYEIEILDGSGDVVRTLNSTTPNAMYSSADQITDFGTTQGAVNLRVFQMSEMVGRGRPGVATV